MERLRDRTGLQKIGMLDIVETWQRRDRKCRQSGARTLSHRPRVRIGV